jgi:cbb3-type cytochrome oxidase subunit 1
VTLRRRVYSPGMAEVQFWLVTFGFLLMMLSLQIGGLIQGAAWMAGMTVPAALPMMKPYFIIRAISGALIVLSGIVQAWNIYKTVTSGERILAGAPAGVEAPGAAEVPA